MKPEISAFLKENWGGELYLDRERQVYRALGDGKLRKQSFFAIIRNFPALRKKVLAAQEQAPGIGNIMHMTVSSRHGCENMHMPKLSIVPLGHTKSDPSGAAQLAVSAQASG